MASADSSQAAEAAAAAAAAAAAFRSLTIEIWTLYAVAASSTFLRTYARVRAVGCKGLGWDDYLVWVGVIFYTCQSALGWSIGNSANGLANNDMTPEQRASLSPDTQEYQMRVLGSQIQVAGWTVYSCLIWALKLSMLAFFTRLTPDQTDTDLVQNGLGRPYRIRINIGFALVLGTFLAAILAIFVGCRPFNHYWQINPDPGNSCQAAISRPIIWTSFAANVTTDIYLILIPLPMLWKSTLRTAKKIASSIVLGAGIFVLVCATLKSVFVLVDPVNGAQLAGSWGIREAFTAVMVTNLPMIFPLFKTWIKPWFASALRSTSQKKTYELRNPSGFRTIGGGTAGEGSGPSHAYSKNRSRTGHGTGAGSSSHAMSTNMTFDNDSEEMIVEEHKMGTIQVTVDNNNNNPTRQQGHPATGIMVSNQVEVTHEDRSSQVSDAQTQKVRDAW
ncbi:uncharacterized protein F5Z01DRAFT_638535 [Emericellopsis atlantica]|uniref:Rhodopsin domain-containing protein n=1 Tax=Emericellopsis atlantica TaxID=2614577 RepID=A0A9P7ZIB1_9HYPO|nr:uncharacterized protein F5Z01DRAFT_638535 [Emericellopsis atlantica]KAG9252261.1 hypothetical protein F5Z01DRAFT_638535 [Emericellopsis atlantica]